MTWRSLLPSTLRNHRDPLTVFRREMERFFIPFEQERILYPEMDICENRKLFQITAELPGLTEKDIKLDLTNNVLTISGEKKVEQEEKEDHYYIPNLNEEFEKS